MGLLIFLLGCEGGPLYTVRCYDQADVLVYEGDCGEWDVKISRRDDGGMSFVCAPNVVPVRTRFEAPGTCMAFPKGTL